MKTRPNFFDEASGNWFAVPAGEDLDDSLVTAIGVFQELMRSYQAGNAGTPMFLFLRDLGAALAEPQKGSRHNAAWWVAEMIDKALASHALATGFGTAYEETLERAKGKKARDKAAFVARMQAAKGAKKCGLSSPETEQGVCHE